MGDMFFDPVIFDPAIFDTVTSRLREVLWKMENVNIANYYFPVGYVEPGFDTADVPLRHILSSLERA